LFALVELPASSQLSRDINCCGFVSPPKLHSQMGWGWVNLGFTQGTICARQWQ